MSGSTCENKIAYSNLDCVHVVNVLAQSYDSPLGLPMNLLPGILNHNLVTFIKGLVT